ncbi:MAG: hypothetical protein IKK11_03730 [Oscillospiraceae bacterium]|nr:hypothetical protein [Oscillospiraceae bacterium]
MLFVSLEDFFAQASGIQRISREQEKDLALCMAAGDETARETLIRSYLPMAANYVRRLPKEMQTLSAAYTCLAAVEKGVDTFNFLQDSETFIHHLSWRLRQAITRCIADRS